eukprot:5040632-Amphidinium_carterae.3
MHKNSDGVVSGAQIISYFGNDKSAPKSMNGKKSPGMRMCGPSDGPSARGTSKRARVSNSPGKCRCHF